MRGQVSTPIIYYRLLISILLCTNKRSRHLCVINHGFFQKWPIICDFRSAISPARHAISLIAISLYYSIQSLQHTQNMKFELGTVWGARDGWFRV